MEAFRLEEKNERLTPVEVSPLRFLFHELETRLGQRSTHGAQIDRLCQISGANAWLEETPVERWICWSNERTRRPVSQAYRTLARMTEVGFSQEVTVLYRTYGPRDPNARYDLFGDLAPLAEYTPVVDALVRRAESDGREVLEKPFVRVSTKGRTSVTTGDVLRRKLELPRVRVDPGMTAAEALRRKGQIKIARDAFVRTICEQAEALLVSASRAYRLARIE